MPVESYWKYCYYIEIYYIVASIYRSVGSHLIAIFMVMKWQTLLQKKVLKKSTIDIVIAPDAMERRCTRNKIYNQIWQDGI